MTNKSISEDKTIPDGTGFMNSEKASGILGGVSNLTTGINSAVQEYTGTQSAINSGIHKGIQALGP